MNQPGRITISGTLEDPCEKGLSGVSITHSSGISSVSDQAGRFSITLAGGPDQEFELLFAKAGYADKVLKLRGKGHRIGFGAPIGRSFNPSHYPRYEGFSLELVEDWKSSAVRTFKSGDKPGVLVGALSSKIVFNFWVFGFGDIIGGDPSGNRYPIECRYDWFRFYRWNLDGEKEMYPET